MYVVQGCRKKIPISKGYISFKSFRTLIFSEASHSCPNFRRTGKKGKKNFPIWIKLNTHRVFGLLITNLNLKFQKNKILGAPKWWTLIKIYLYNTNLCVLFCCLFQMCSPNFKRWTLYGAQTVLKIFNCSGESYKGSH